MDGGYEWQGGANWIPNTLYRRESIASIIAKFSIANQIIPSRFAAMVVKMRFGGEGYGSAASRRVWTMRAAGPEVRRLATLLGESPEVVGSATLNDLPTPCAWMDEHLGNYFYSACLRGFCEECLREGYHSVFHQVPWLRKCFIHGIPLTYAERSQVPSKGAMLNMREDSGLANFLYDRWRPLPSREVWWGVDVNHRPFNRACWRRPKTEPHLRVVPT